MKKFWFFVILLLVSLFITAESVKAVVPDCNITFSVSKEGGKEAFLKVGETVKVVFASNCPSFLVVLQPDGVMKDFHGNQNLKLEVIKGMYYFLVVYDSDKGELDKLLEDFGKRKTSTQKDGFDHISSFNQRIRHASHLKAKTEIYKFQVN